MCNNNWGGFRKGSGRTPLDSSKKKHGVKIYITEDIKNEIIKYGDGKNFSDKAVDVIIEGLLNKKILSK